MKRSAFVILPLILLFISFITCDSENNIFSNEDGTSLISHQITIKNNCIQNIWIGAHPQVQSITINNKQKNTLGGWELKIAVAVQSGHQVIQMVHVEEEII